MRHFNFCCIFNNVAKSKISKITVFSDWLSSRPNGLVLLVFEGFDEEIHPKRLNSVLSC